MLEERFNSDKFEFLPIYGRKRVGKSTLLWEFFRGHEGVFFTASQDSLKSNIDRLGSMVLGTNISMSIDTLFEEIWKRSINKRYVLIIDEYPRMASREKFFGDCLQEFIDSKGKNTKLFLILCGSSISVMEHEVLGYASPLYGRRTGSLKIKPFGFRESLHFLRGFSRDDAFSIYGMVGGIPLYLEQFNSSYTLQENLIRLFLKEDSFFRAEPYMCLIEDFEKPYTYYSVIEAVSFGKDRVKEIAEFADLDAPTTTKYLDILGQLDIVLRSRPADNPNGKVTKYTVSDPFFRFYFSRIRPIVENIDPLDERSVADRILALFKEDMGPIFESICAEHFRSVHGGVIGKWWGSDPASKTIEEIDIVLTRNDNGYREGWFAECKYRSEPTGMEVLATLRHRVGLVKGYDSVHYAIYSRSGFTKALQSADGVELYTVDDLLGKELCEMFPPDRT